MFILLSREKASISFKAIVIFLCVSFILSSAVIYLNKSKIPAYAAFLPEPKALIPLSEQFTPSLIRGITLYSDDPFKFVFLLDSGDSQIESESLRRETSQLIKYFLAALTIPDKDLWVNLSPYEKDRITTDDLGVTEMGKGLLSQDYVLKQLLSSVTYPESPLGKKFWEEIYRRAQIAYGTTNIPINTFNKIWIVPGKAVVYEDGNSAYVLESNLKVMLEEDYLALNNAQMTNDKFQLTNSAFRTPLLGGTRGSLWSHSAERVNEFASDVMREIIVPAVEKEVNAGKNFAQLRQVYNSLILAVWFKRRLKEPTYILTEHRNVLSNLYIDKCKVKGVDVEDKKVREKIYNTYLEAYKKGVYDYIRTDTEPQTQKQINRRYYSGGCDFTALSFNIVSSSSISPNQQLLNPVGSIFKTKVELQSTNMVSSPASSEDRLAVKSSSPITNKGPMPLFDEEKELIETRLKDEKIKALYDEIKEVYDELFDVEGLGTEDELVKALLKARDLFYSEGGILDQWVLRGGEKLKEVARNLSNSADDLGISPAYIETIEGPSQIIVDFYDELGIMQSGNLSGYSYDEIISRLAKDIYNISQEEYLWIDFSFAFIENYLRDKYNSREKLVRFVSKSDFYFIAGTEGLENGSLRLEQRSIEQALSSYLSQDFTSFALSKLRPNTGVDSFTFKNQALANAAGLLRSLWDNNFNPHNQEVNKKAEEFLVSLKDISEDSEFFNEEELGRFLAMLQLGLPLFTVIDETDEGAKALHQAVYGIAAAVDESETAKKVYLQILKSRTISYNQFKMYCNNAPPGLQFVVEAINESELRGLLSYKGERSIRIIPHEEVNIICISNGRPSIPENLQRNDDVIAMTSSLHDITNYSGHTHPLGTDSEPSDEDIDKDKGDKLAIISFIAAIDENRRLDVFYTEKSGQWINLKDEEALSKLRELGLLKSNVSSSVLSEEDAEKLKNFVRRNQNNPFVLQVALVLSGVKPAFLLDNSDKQNIRVVNKLIDSAAADPQLLSPDRKFLEDGKMLIFNRQKVERILEDPFYEQFGSNYEDIYELLEKIFKAEKQGELLGYGQRSITSGLKHYAEVWSDSQFLFGFADEDFEKVELHVQKHIDMLNEISGDTARAIISRQLNAEEERQVKAVLDQAEDGGIISEDVRREIGVRIELDSQVHIGPADQGFSWRDRKGLRLYPSFVKQAGFETAFRLAFNTMLIDRLKEDIAELQSGMGNVPLSAMGEAFRNRHPEAINAIAHLERENRQIREKMQTSSPAQAAGREAGVSPDREGNHPGGIDLNSANLDLEVRRGPIGAADIPQASEFIMPFDIEDFEGFTFRIIEIKPVKTLGDLTSLFN
ncbi:MAG: hypothetical protein ABH872_02335 [Candidatus Omnitrophota bacterium]